MAKKTILVTGSSGMIGTRLMERLQDKYEAVGFDRKPNPWNKQVPKLTVRGDLLRPNDLKKLPKGIDAVVHLAANARVHDLVANPKLAEENLRSVFTMLEYARTNGIRRFIFASSREVYGNRKRPKADESQISVDTCESAYAASKIAGEALARSYAKCYGMEVVILRFSNVYGMYDTSDRFIPIMIRKMRRHQPVEIYGKDKLLDFTYIDDCVDGIMLALEKFPKAKGQSFNIATGRGHKLVDVAALLKDRLGSRSKVSLGKSRVGEVVGYVADISRAKKLLGYQPKVSLKDGIGKSIEWYGANA